MKAIKLSQVEPQAHVDILTPIDLAEAILEADADSLESILDHGAGAEIDDAVEGMLINGESMEAFLDYNEIDVVPYRVGDVVCLHWRAVGVVTYGTAQEHAADFVSSFRQHEAEEAAEAEG